MRFNYNMNKEQYFEELKNIQQGLRDLMYAMKATDDNVEWNKLNDQHYDLLQVKKKFINQRYATVKANYKK